MSDKNPVEKFRSDYCVPDFSIDHVELDFQLGAESTQVKARMQMQRTEPGSSVALQLDGEDLVLDYVGVDGQELAAGALEHNAEGLTIAQVPDSFLLETTVSIKPQENTQLSGLYSSGSMFCTQCEAEGFRRITFFPDRPDVMTTFTVRIEADQKAFPVLLSNGNQIEAGQVDGGRHFAVWQDPFKKPSYLFALVAGDLGSISDSFTTASGREVSLHIYTEHRNVDQLDYAMLSLKNSMIWDEQVFGLEYDLDIFNIVAVGDFNMGAMENKSLNVFNTAYVLARPDTATDCDYEGIEGVIGHEYFHNWTGNRVTCKDWFQLTLKEGLTVFRDQQFSADMGSAAVKRIESVKGLRGVQFREDSGPMAHPIRPESYIAMDNFYTATVYSKGAEVIRMYHTLLGQQGFRKGMDLYFERHDGQAVSCDDFRAAMSDANSYDLDQFERWYLQAGTPKVAALGVWNEEESTYSLTLSQSCAPTPGQEEKLPFHIPVAVGLLDHLGEEIAATEVLDLKEQSQTFVFEDIAAQPVPSILRGFSAPVRLDVEQSDSDLALLFAFDSDSFNRWEAGQRFATRVILNMVADLQAGKEAQVPVNLIHAFRTVFQDTALDYSLKSYAMRLPDETTLGAEMSVIDPDNLHKARELCVHAIATALRTDLETLYAELKDDGEYVVEAGPIGKRRMRNLCLGYLTSLKEDSTTAMAQAQYQAATNMTDKFAAVACLTAQEGPARQAVLDDFYQAFKEEALVVDKWLAVQAGSPADNALENVIALLDHEAFDIKNPNKVRSLIRTFTANQLHFHRPDGAGYRFIADQVIKLDALNPQVASRIVGGFAQWQRFDDSRQQLMVEQLVRISQVEGLSKDCSEIVDRSLKAAQIAR
ncbi:MAG: aminopeptidase N [Planctomycetes bacterium]|nr:aminopeptidase N [Planctomycetota bacterium]